MFSFMIAFCLFALVVLLAFKWFPKTATMLTIVYVWVAVAMSGDLIGDTAQEVLLFVCVLFFFGLPIYWLVKEHDRRTWLRG